VPTVVREKKENAMNKYKKNRRQCNHTNLFPQKQPKTALKKKAIRTLENKPIHIQLNLEVYMLHLGKFLQNLWKATLGSNLHKKDKAEILRMLIFAFTITVIIALLVLNRP
jgi:hypothetical protein